MPANNEGRPDSVPRNYEDILGRIANEYEDMSQGHQKISRFITQNPVIVSLESLKSIAAKSGAHPSSLVRFAQALGCSGFRQLQLAFQTRLTAAAPGFREPTSAHVEEISANESRGNLGYLRDLVAGDMAALQGLLESVPEECLAMTAELLTKAESVYIAGQLKSEPAASLLRYLLAMLHRRVVLLDPAGGLALEMALGMTSRDVLVTIAFRHYAKEVVAISQVAVANAVPIVAITDSQLAPLAKDAKVLFTIPEDESTISRSLAAPMCLVQCIAVATAAVLQPSRKEGPRIPTVTEIARERTLGEMPRSQASGEHAA